MATWVPINGLAIQLAKNAGGAAAADYYLKFYDEGTTTPASMATDSTGGTTLDKCKLDANGLAVNGSDDPFIPHIDRNYKIACYTNATDADNNATGSAFFVIDNVKLGSAEGALYTPEGTNPTTVSIATYLDKRVLDDVAALRAYEPVVDEDQVFILVHTTKGIGGGHFYYDETDTTSADNNGSIIVTPGGARWKRPGSSFSVMDFGAVADGDITETSPYSATNNATPFLNALEHLTNIGGGRLYIPAGQYRIETTTFTDLLRVTSNVTIEGAGPNSSLVYQTKGGSSVFGTVFSIGDNADVKTKTGVAVVGAELSEFIANDFSKIQVENVAIRNLGVGSAPDVRIAGNQGLWITNARNVFVENIANYGCSTPVSIGNDRDESCSNISVKGIQQVEGGRWYTLFIGASQFINVSDITQPKYASPALGCYNVIRSQFVTLSNVTASGEPDGVLWTGRKTIGEFHTSRNCTLTNGTFTETAGNGVTVFNVFNPADPGGDLTAGVTHHSISNLTFIEANNCVTLYTSENVVSNINAEGPITGDVIRFETNSDDNTVYLSRKLINSGSITEGGSIRNNIINYSDMRTDFTQRIPPGLEITDVFGGTSVIGRLNELFGVGLEVQSGGALRLRGAGPTGDYLYLDFDTPYQFYPSVDNKYDWGRASNRWDTFFAGTGTINTSDEREKTFFDIEQAEKDAALEIKDNLRKFKFNSAIESKGEDARIHFGASAQQVGEILTSHGLNPEDYAFYCYDEWEEEIDDDGSVKTEAGNLYGIRYEELLVFILVAT